MELKHKIETVFSVTYRDFNKFIQDQTGRKDYSVISDDPCGQYLRCTLPKLCNACNWPSK